MFAARRFAALALFAALGLVVQVAAAEGPRVWRRAEVRRGVGDSAVRVLAVEDPRAQLAPRIAVGGHDGVTLWRAPVAEFVADGANNANHSERIAAPRRLSQLAFVQDLHFADDGALWIATARGLWRLGSAGRLEDRSPGSGEEARFIHRVSSLAGVTFAATQSGAYATSDGRRWLRLSGDLPLGPAGPLALRRGRSTADAQALEVWLVVRGVTRRLELQPFENSVLANESAPRALAGWTVSSGERLSPVSGLRPGAIPLQILLDWPDADVALLYEDAIAVRREPGSTWEVVRPVLPPQAKAAWLARAGDDYWLATDRGLMRAQHWRGPWRRAASPVGSAEVHRVVEAGGRVLAGTSQGLFVAPVAPGVPAFARAKAPPPPMGVLVSERLGGLDTGLKLGSDPPVRAVQRAALRYLGLGVDHVRGLHRGIARRGWLPVLSVRVAGASDRDSAVDYDEAFVSGATRYLYDRDWHRGRDLDASVVLSWNLGNLAYDPESIDLSREARQLISLRDDVLDQINQAYFERQALLRAIEAAPVGDEEGRAQQRKLQLRVDELAAGLDGWTGGWFGKQSAGRP